MKKKFLTLIFTLTAMLMCIFGFSACGGGNISSDENSVEESTEDSSSEEISPTIDKLAFKTLSVNETTVSGVVSNATETFSFINEIETTGKSKFVVSLDIYGTQQVASKIVPLNSGDNTIYITEMIDYEPVNLYTVTIRRRPMYSVWFNTQGGTYIQTQQIEEDSFAVMPNEPTRDGYTFADWNFDFAQPITQNVTVTPNWTAKPCTLTIVYGNGQSDTIITQDCGTKIEIEVGNLTREYYEFIGWDKIIPTTMPAGNVTITAQWRSIFTCSGKTVTGLTDYGKANCAQIVIPSSIDGVAITAIGDYAFAYCNDLTSIEITDGVTSIGDYAFAYCNDLTSVEIPDSVTIIGDHVFKEDRGLINVVMGNGVTRIGHWTFSWCSSLTSVEIPDSVTSIGNFAFVGCGRLTSIEISDGVTSIGSEAFKWCNGLTSIVIGNGVTSIGYAAFIGCGNLKTVYYKGTASDWANISINEGINLTSATRYYYSETQPTEAGNYWYYDESGNIAIW